MHYIHAPSDLFFPSDMRHGSSSPRRLAHRESALRRSLTEPRRATATRTAPPPPPLVAHMHILVPSDDGGYEAFVEDMFDGLPPVCCIESLSESTGGIEEWDIAGPSARDVESAEYLSDSENSDASEWSDDAPGPSTRHRLGFDISYENTPQWAVAGPSAPPDERPIHEPSPVHFAVDEGDQDETEWDRRSASSEYQHLPQNEPSESSDAEKNRIWQDLPCFNSWKIGKETRVSGPVVVPTKRKMSTQEVSDQSSKVNYHSTELSERSSWRKAASICAGKTAAGECKP